MEFSIRPFVVLYEPVGEAMQVFHAVYLIIFILFFSPYKNAAACGNEQVLKRHTGQTE